MNQLQLLKQDLQKASNPKRAKVLQGYFKTYDHSVF